MTPPGDPATDRDDEVTALYRQHSREVWALAYARLLDRDLALDVMHESFLRFWKQHEHGATIDNPRAWLLRVAKNLAEDQANSAFRRNRTQPPEQLDGVPKAGTPPLEHLEQGELFALIHAMLEELPTADREILTMRYALDYDAATIAERLHLPVTAVHMRLSRARQRLGEKLTAHGVTR